MFLKTFEKMQATSLYWFAAQQQTSSFKRQESGFFYASFSSELNEIIMFFLKAAGKDLKMTKTKVVQKDANKRRLKTYG